MTFSGLFAIGLSGVNAFTQSLEAVSNNIANTQTTGFKRSTTEFSTLIAAETAGGGVTAGGVSASSRALVNQQGAIARTNSATDMAISGGGFFIVSADRENNAATTLQFTRAGGFAIQTDGALANEAGYYLRAAPTNADGAVALSSITGLETVNVNRIASLAEATSTLTLAGNLDADAAPGTTLTRRFQIFDAAGAARELSLTFVKAAPDRWTVTAAFADGAAETLASGDIVFAAGGGIDAAASTFPFAFAGAATGGRTLDVDFGSLFQTARASEFTLASADGAAPGALTGVEISRDGRVAALFANGLRRDIYQIVLATFVNPEGLEAGPSSTYLTNPDAGALSLGLPQTGRAGGVEARALEASTVDIAQEFSTLIETQRAYAANARIITTADELWRTLAETAG